mmetsp:Transcript_13668/g.2176  ORF Transcript_13668/g.2176 Transcript_13668/m.2176 type:complete len:85 (-) Transcript_13668:156-410(-)
MFVLPVHYLAQNVVHLLLLVLIVDLIRFYIIIHALINALASSIELQLLHLIPVLPVIPHVSTVMLVDLQVVQVVKIITYNKDPV